MGMRPFGYYVIRTLRFTSWPLLLLLMLYLLTGFSISGRYGFGRLMHEKQAAAYHKALHVPLLVLFPVHTLCGVYLAFRRWGWLKK